jgi:hypothetical protein
VFGLSFIKRFYSKGIEFDRMHHLNKEATSKTPGIHRDSLLPSLFFRSCYLALSFWFGSDGTYSKATTSLVSELFYGGLDRGVLS